MRIRKRWYYIAGGLVIAFGLGALAALVVVLRLNDEVATDALSVGVTTEGFERGVPASVSVIPSDIDFRVESSGYYPGRDTLIGTTNVGQDYPKMYLVSDRGEVKRAWKIDNKFGGILGDRRILPNGNIMFTIQLDGIYEIDFDGNLVWHHIDDTVTHHAELLPNGRVLTAGVGCDCVKEIDYETKQVVWQWDATPLFPEYNTEEAYIGSTVFTGTRSAYAGYSIASAIFPHDWTHINYVQWLPDTDTFMISLRSFDLVLEVDRAGSVVWTFGPGVIKHQHYPRVLDDNTVLIFDNGNGRVIRVNRNHEILWEYDGLYVPFLGDNDLLDDGNYKIVQTTAFEATGGASDIRIVSEAKEVLWKLIVPGQHVYRAFMTEG